MIRTIHLTDTELLACSEIVEWYRRATGRSIGIDIVNDLQTALTLPAPDVTHAYAQGRAVRREQAQAVSTARKAFGI